MSIQNLLKTNNYELYVDSLKFNGSNQLFLNKYFTEEITILTTGALSSNCIYRATRIGNIVNLSISLTSGSCLSNSSAITIELENDIFKPLYEQCGNIRIQTNTGTLTDNGLIKISGDGNIYIYSGNTDTSYFTMGNIIGLGYPTGYFSIFYHVI